MCWPRCLVAMIAWGSKPPNAYRFQPVHWLTYLKGWFGFGKDIEGPADLRI